MRGRREGLGRGLKREAEARLLPFALGMDCCWRDGHENMGQGPAGWMAGNFARSAIPADWLRSPSFAHFAPDQWRMPQAETDHRLLPSSGGRIPNGNPMEGASLHSRREGQPLAQRSMIIQHRAESGAAPRMADGKFILDPFVKQNRRLFAARYESDERLAG